MSDHSMVYLKRTLLKQRQEIFERLRRTESGWQALGEREIEIEEQAQEADLTGLFGRLVERGKEEIEEIDLALSKMAAGSYGVCEMCQKPISSRRLQVLPATRLCRKCAGKCEKARKKLAQV